MRVAVVGAGITGLSTARTLIDAGHEVVLVERAGAPAAGASARNGAQLSYAFVAPFASPATLRQIPQLMLDPNSPLRFRPGFSPAAWRWCIEFLLACSARQAQETTAVLLSLGALSRDRFAAWR
ncbi:partial D-amino acid dehydrogenase, partial [Burkholderiaceae bacterium]